MSQPRRSSLGMLLRRKSGEMGKMSKKEKAAREAELQRQAEARAAILAQNQMEELEFRAARQQLAHVDLRPPKSWRGGDVQSTPRSQVQANRSSAAYSQPAFAGAPAYAASAASTHSRG